MPRLPLQVSLATHGQGHSAGVHVSVLCVPVKGDLVNLPFLSAVSMGKQPGIVSVR